VPEKRLVDLFNMLLNGNHLFLVLLRCSWRTARLQQSRSVASTHSLTWALWILKPSSFFFVSFVWCGPARRRALQRERMGKKV